MRMKKNLDTILFEKLKDEIIAGKWKPGQEILIDDLADHFGVSRTPVIQAARMMAVEGMFIFNKKNGRIEVPVLEAKQVIDIYEMRFLLEDYAIKKICKTQCTLDKENLNAIAKECFAQQHILHNAVASRRADLKLHKNIVASAGNDCLLSSYIKVQGQFMVSNYLLVSHDERLQSKAGEEHEIILEHLYSYNYEKAREALEQHIMNGCHRVISGHFNIDF